jgi:cytochrome P450
LSDNQLLAEIGTFVMGGFETTAHTLSFTMFCIASNKTIQDTLENELRNFGLLQCSNANIPLKTMEYDDLQYLTYLDGVLKESMRMFSVVAGFPRCNYHAANMHTRQKE